MATRAPKQKKQTPAVEGVSSADMSLFERLYRVSNKPSEHMATPWLHAANPTLTSFHSSEKTGKWCIFREREQIDETWEIIKGACARGELMLAKCASAMGGFRFGNTHVICVYTRDYTDEVELMSTRQILGDLGFVEELGYKRDEDTRRGVYGTEDEWCIRI